jgi:alkanesulfonate monooxygenase SsuD/methylene tetrahydromethanopterin reductase-like flavin-dependent oxidoreductase (luciferase family)
MVEFGILLHTAREIRDDEHKSDLTRVFEQAAHADSLGVDRIWLGDSSRMEQVWPRADFATLLAAIAVRTTQVGIGVIPLSTPLRNPVLLAHELATIDVLSNGRLVIAPSTGKGGTEGAREFRNCGVPFNERGARLSEMLQIMRMLWTQPTVDFDGKFYQLADATIFPKPHNRPILQFVATGRDERALRRAGRYGDGWFSSGGNFEAFAEDRQKVTDSALEAGRSASAVAPSGLYVTIHLESTDAHAVEDGPKYITEYFGTHPPRENNWFGAPGTIATRLQQYVDLGLSMVVVRFIDSNLAKQVELMREALSIVRLP